MSVLEAVALRFGILLFPGHFIDLPSNFSRFVILTCCIIGLRGSFLMINVRHLNKLFLMILLLLAYLLPQELCACDSSPALYVSTSVSNSAKTSSCSHDCCCSEQLSSEQVHSVGGFGAGCCHQAGDYSPDIAASIRFASFEFETLQPRSCLAPLAVASSRCFDCRPPATRLSHHLNGMGGSRTYLFKRSLLI